MKSTVVLWLLALQLSLSAQDKPAYKVFTGTGKKSDYTDILKDAGKADVVFFGKLMENKVNENLPKAQAIKDATMARTYN